MLSNGVNELRYKAVLSASPKLTLFLFGSSIPNLQEGVTWARSDGTAVAPLMDPSLPLMLKRGRALGGGRYRVRIAGADAALLAPIASRDQLRRGFTGTTWLDKARHVIRFKATVPFGSSRATIDERFSGFGAPVKIALPRPETVYDPSVEVVRRLVVAALADIEAFNADHADHRLHRHDGREPEADYDTNFPEHLRSSLRAGTPIASKRP